jgi:preprotein translocase subunit YajC
MTWPLLFASAPADAGSSNPLFQLIPFVVIFGVFWFLFIGPMRKERKKTQELLSNLKSGDRVVTVGGLRGRIVGITDDMVKLQIAQSVQVEISRSAVTGKLAEEA